MSYFILVIAAIIPTSGLNGLPAGLAESDRLGPLVVEDCDGCALAGTISPLSDFNLEYAPNQFHYGGACKPDCATDKKCKPANTSYRVKNNHTTQSRWLQQLTSIGQPTGGRIEIKPGKWSLRISLPEDWPELDCGNQKVVAKLCTAQTGGTWKADVVINCGPCLPL